MTRLYSGETTPLIVEGIRKEAVDYIRLYDIGTPLGLRDEFEMALVTAIALSNDVDAAEYLDNRLSYERCPNGYSFYSGYKRAMMGLLLDHDKYIEQAQQDLANSRGTKMFYWPGQAVIEAAMIGDLAALKEQVSAISRKFDGYAKKCGALNTLKGNRSVIDLSLMHNHYTCPYTDWAYFVHAMHWYGDIESDSTFWMPMSWLRELAGR